MQLLARFHCYHHFERIVKKDNDGVIEWMLVLVRLMQSQA